MLRADNAHYFQKCKKKKESDSDGRLLPSPAGTRRRCRHRVAATVYQQLRSASGKQAMRSYWMDKITVFSTFDLDLKTSTTDAEISNIINLLKEIASLQEEFKRSRDAYAYILFGAAPLFEGKNDATVMNTLKTKFQRVINEAKPDLVLYRTALLKDLSGANTSNCHETGHTVWENAPLPHIQASFVECLGFRNQIRLPPPTREALAFHLGGRWSDFFSQPFTVPEVMAPLVIPTNKLCRWSGSASSLRYLCYDPEDQAPDGKRFVCYHCREHAQDVIDQKRVLRLLRSFVNWVLAIDTNVTMRVKMCKARQQGFHGGYVMFGLQDIINGNALEKNICNDTYSDGYRDILHVKDYLNDNFRVCPSLENWKKRPDDCPSSPGGHC
ncbi:uncharacterized protein LOC135389040 isoform X2 [Ornithodoros turicata]|uniref:uncharacterized protein LOC135389040 isoform X2 n=1 Tax=Ornithodoros turicata TaxID=34597 RepID=UPI003138EA34